MSERERDISTPAQAGVQYRSVCVPQPACVYMMASRRNGTIYLGSALDLPKRAWEHRNGVVPGFTRRYGCKLLVWYEHVGDWEAARHREKQMKEWNRAWKIREIEGMNPDWADLYEGIAHPWMRRSWTPACAGVD